MSSMGQILPIESQRLLRTVIQEKTGSVVSGVAFCSLTRLEMETQLDPQTGG